MNRTIEKQVTGQQTFDGAGVDLVRVLGHPTSEAFDPFLMLDSFDSTEPEAYKAGFPMHPHRGIETISYIASGKMMHRDSLGHEDTISDGEVQWMTAGSALFTPFAERQRQAEDDYRRGKAEAKGHGGCTRWIIKCAEEKHVDNEGKQAGEKSERRCFAHIFEKKFVRQHPEVPYIIEETEKTKPTFVVCEKAEHGDDREQRQQAKGIEPSHEKTLLSRCGEFRSL